VQKMRKGDYVTMNKESIRNNYINNVVPKWMTEGKVSNIMAMPAITKIIVNTGIGDIKENKDMIEQLVEQMGKITGQKPVVTKARQSIAAFNVREGMPVGVRVTLRGERMYHFLEKLFSYTLPRTRDFQGISPNGFDGHGNYSFGLTEQLPFLEIDPNNVRRSFGLQVTIVTSTNDDTIARELLTELGAPFSTSKEEGEKE